MKKIAWILSLLLIFTLCACTISDGTTVATVNGKKISGSEYKFFLAQVKQQTEQTEQTTDTSEAFWGAQESDGKTFEEVAKEKALDEIINQYVAREKAIESGIEMNQTAREEIGRQKSSVISQLGGDSAFESWLKENGLTENMYDNLLESSWYEYKLVEEMEEVSDEDALAYYVENNVTVKHILVKTTDDNNQPLSDEQIAEKEKLAEQLLARAKGGEDFDALVQEYSEDPGSISQPQGYTFGENSGMVKPFEDASLALEVGEISDLVPTDFGYHIIKRYETLTDEFEANKENVKYMVKYDKIDEQVAAWRDEMSITIDEDEIAKIKITEL